MIHGNNDGNKLAAGFDADDDKDDMEVGSLDHDNGALGAMSTSTGSVILAAEADDGVVYLPKLDETKVTLGLRNNDDKGNPRTLTSPPSAHAALTLAGASRSMTTSNPTDPASLYPVNDTRNNNDDDDGNNKDNDNKYSALPIPPIVSPCKNNDALLVT